MRRIILGLTGSVATILYEKLITQLQTVADVDVILTEKAQHFVDMATLCDALEKKGGLLYTEENEWTWKCFNSTSSKWQRGDRVLHIELRDKSSALVIAPCSAATMGKMANGICDNLLTSVARAWNLNRPLVIAPAMNTQMWEHPVTKEHTDKFVKWGYKIVPPQSKMLACNTLGMGAMANVEEIVKAVKNSLRWTFPFPWDYTLHHAFHGDSPCSGIPVNGHPGCFNAKRKNSIHTGVDLYADVGQVVVPVEDGTVVAVEPFTGPKDKSPWWLDTSCVLVEGATGVVCYGEIEPHVKVGQHVRRGDTCIGTVLRVIPEDKPQHPELPGWKPSMLHMEVYPHGQYKPSDGYGESFTYLQDPTPFLIDAVKAPTNLLTK